MNQWRPWGKGKTTSSSAFKIHKSWIVAGVYCADLLDPSVMEKLQKKPAGSLSG